MNIFDARQKAAAFVTQAEAEGDVALAVYFSRESDMFCGFEAGMDAGDALIVIKHLVRIFGLDADATAAAARGGAA